MSSRRISLWMIAGASCVPLVVSSPDAQEKFRKLGDKEIRTKIVGNDITDGVHWFEYYRRDGALISMHMGKQRSGTWKIQDNKLCVSKQKGQPLDCYEVWLSGNKVNLRENRDDTDSLVATIEKHEGD